MRVCAMKLLNCRWLLAGLLSAVLLCPALAMAQDVPATAPAAAAPAAAPAVDASQVLIGAAADGTKYEVNSGDTAWMLVSTALVLMMTGPGLALFYGGLVRRKNVLATMMQSFILMAVVSIVWAVVGYSLAFDVGNPYFGGFRFAMLREVGADPC